jgi:hypothetical protein
MTKELEGSEMNKVMERGIMTSIRHLGAAGAAIAILGSAPQVLGESAPPVTETIVPVGQVLTVGGEVRCARFAIGSGLVELTKDDPGRHFVLTGALGQRIEGVVSNGTTLEWQATVPVDFVIVRGKRRKHIESSPVAVTDDDSGFGFRSVSHVYVFGSDPATFDSGESAPDLSAIQQIRFCYGLSEEPQVVPRCSDIEDGPRCPLDDSGVERNGSIFFLDFDKRDFGGAPECTCGELVLRACNVNVDAGEPNACAGGTWREPNLLIEAIKNVTDTASTTCRTKRARRDCSRSED